ncbi:hypothetical protein D3C73_1573020 [compost metagenome]
MLFSSSDNKHPGLEPTTLTSGFAVQVPASQISLIAPKPFGSIAKEAFEQTLAATLQSPATVGPAEGQVSENVIPDAAVEVASIKK